MLPQEIVYHQTNSQPNSPQATNPFSVLIQETPISGINWKPFEPTSVVVTIPLVVVAILVFTIVYYIKARRLKPDQAPNGYVLMVELYVLGIEKMTVDLFGQENKKFTPYFLMILTYLGFSNLFSLIGNLSPPTSSLTVTATLGLMTFLGTYVVAFRYQRLRFLKTFTVNVKIKGRQIPVMINPLEVIGQIAPLLSISMRLWGNIFSGTLIMALLYSLIQFIFQNVNPVILGLTLGSVFGGMITPVFHSYFDVAIGLLQAYVFLMLTYSYWSKQQHDEQGQKIPLRKQKNHELKKQNASEVFVQMKVSHIN